VINADLDPKKSEGMGKKKAREVLVYISSGAE
jgi:hypothetical protein